MGEIFKIILEFRISRLTFKKFKHHDYNSFSVLCPVNLKSVDHLNLKLITFGPLRKKTCLRGFRQSESQTSPLSYRDYLENWNFTRSKFTYKTFQKENNKGTDQTARMRRLVCACVVRKPRRQVFSWRGPFCRHTASFKISNFQAGF